MAQTNVAAVAAFRSRERKKVYRFEWAIFSNLVSFNGYIA
jgi:hypothetical protein